MELRIIRYGTKHYEEMVSLRMDILRRPLGLSFTSEQLDAEKDDLLIGAFEDGRIIGCCVLTPYNDTTIQLRQMAVSESAQAKGIGKNILAFAERKAREKGYTILMMHARNTALGFYEKCGYKITGGEFVEVTIPHHCMEKTL